MRVPFTKKKKKTYADFVAPLVQMVTDLKGYISEQTEHISDQNIKKAEIEADIKNSEKEIMKSENSINKLSDVVVIDAD